MTVTKQVGTFVQHGKGAQVGTFVQDGKGN